MIVSCRHPTVGAAALICAVIAEVKSGRAQDPYVVQTPVDVAILTDWSALWYPEGVYSSEAATTQSPEQQALNRARLDTRPSSHATRHMRGVVAAMMQDDPELGALFQRSMDDPGAAARYRAALSEAGFDPDNLADVIAAYTLAVYALAQDETGALSAPTPEQQAAAKRMVEDFLITYLPGSLSEADLRAVLEETRAQHIFQTYILEMSRNEPAEDFAFIVDALIERSDDYALVDVRAVRLDPRRGFVQR